MNRLLNAIAQAYARPPLSWLVTTFQWIQDLVSVPLRGPTRWHARRRQAELADLAERLAAIGLARQADQVTDLAARWGEIAEAGRSGVTR